MNPKYQKVCAEIAKTETKVEDLQGSSRSCTTRKPSWKILKSSTPSVRWSWTRIRSCPSLAAMKDSKAEKPTTTQQEVTDND